jgi:ubiquinone/menaquinone biosynthesis C-methylase UbiE
MLMRNSDCGMRTGEGMKTTDFTEISARYERDSLIQKSAADRLISLLGIARNDDVLDLGCGTGSLMRKIRALTDGRVVGVDPSAGMIREAELSRGGLDVSFAVKSAEQIDYHDAFSVVFCNSAIQWFPDLEKALKNCHQVLRIGGRMGTQAPAKKSYCPNFLAAIDAVAKDSRSAKTFEGFRPPWLFLDTADEYAALFRHAGFAVPFAKIETDSTLHSPDEVMTIFESGAAAGYLNQEYYSTPVDEAYAKAFREVVRGSFERQANQAGKVELVFNRIYLVAIK